MADFGTHDQNAGLVGVGDNVVVHFEIRGQFGHGLCEMVERVCMAEMDSHEELLMIWVGELLEIEDVEVVFGQDAGDCVDDSGLVGTREGKDMIFLHVGYLSWLSRESCG